jgi:hypothetical protein
MEYIFKPDWYSWVGLLGQRFEEVCTDFNSCYLFQIVKLVENFRGTKSFWKRFFNMIRRLFWRGGQLTHIWKNLRDKCGSRDASWIALILTVQEKWIIKPWPEPVQSSLHLHVLLEKDLFCYYPVIYIREVCVFVASHPSLLAPVRFCVLCRT